MLKELFKNTEQKKPQGKLIVIDGANDAMKAEQIDLLASTLQSSGYDGVLLDFPQYTEASAPLLEKYLAGDYGILHPEAVSIIFAIDRFDGSSKIKAYLDAGKVIITNRYITSSAGHQGSRILDYNERVKFYRWLHALEYSKFGIPQPHLTIILHNENDGADNPIEQSYLEFAQLVPNTKVIEIRKDGQQLSTQAIHTKIWELVRRMVLKDVKPH